VSATPTTTASSLEITAGPAAGSTIEIPGGGLRIGRAQGAGGDLGGDPELSREHARVLALADGGLLVEDLSSTNGTFVNGTRIAAATLLRPGDELELGGTRARVLGAAADLAAGATASKPSEPARRPALRVIAGNAPGAIIGLDDGPVTLGSSSSGLLDLGGDPSLAPEHARVLARADGSVLVEDLGSPGGTLLDGRRIPGPTIVQLGDRFEVGASALEVIGVAGTVSSTSGAPELALGGVRSRPEGLFALIGRRAPVTAAQVRGVVIVSIGWALAINLLIRTISQEDTSIPNDLTAFALGELIPGTVFPALFNGFGFFKGFHRPDDKSFARYLIPTFVIPLIGTAVALIRLNDGRVGSVLVTIAVTIMPIIIQAPLMLRMRSRVADQRVRAARPD
jgi:pSer/pThr/pTyr-binding forkhead associated (FHA) protein